MRHSGWLPIQDHPQVKSYSFYLDGLELPISPPRTPRLDSTMSVARCRKYRPPALPSFLGVPLISPSSLQQYLKQICILNASLQSCQIFFFFKIQVFASCSSIWPIDCVVCSSESVLPVHSSGMQCIHRAISRIQLGVMISRIASPTRVDFLILILFHLMASAVIVKKFCVYFS